MTNFSTKYSVDVSAYKPNNLASKVLETATTLIFPVKHIFFSLIKFYFLLACSVSVVSLITDKSLVSILFIFILSQIPLIFISIFLTIRSYVSLTFGNIIELYKGTVGVLPTIIKDMQGKKITITKDVVADVLAELLQSYLVAPLEGRMSEGKGYLGRKVFSVVSRILNQINAAALNQINSYLDSTAENAQKGLQKADVNLFEKLESFDSVIETTVKGKVYGTVTGRLVKYIGVFTVIQIILLVVI